MILEAPPGCPRALYEGTTQRSHYPHLVTVDRSPQSAKLNSVGRQTVDLKYHDRPSVEKWQAKL